MKNIKNFFIINRVLGVTKISDIKKHATGKIIIVGASTRNEMWKTLESLSLEFGVLVRVSPLFDIKPKDLYINHPGFVLISDIEEKNEAETVIIVANTTYIAGILFFLHNIKDIGIPLMDILVTNQTLHIKNGDEKEARYI